MSTEPQRRRFPRIATHHAVLVKRMGDEGVEEFARTNTMGTGGCGFLSSEKLGEGELLDLLISLRQEVISAKARVVYELEQPDGRWEVGVEFLQLNAADGEKIKGLLETPQSQGT